MARELGCIELKRIIGRSLADWVRETVADDEPGEPLEIRDLDHEDILAMASEVAGQVFTMSREPVMLVHDCARSRPEDIHVESGSLTEWARDIGWEVPV